MASLKLKEVGRQLDADTSTSAVTIAMQLTRLAFSSPCVEKHVSSAVLSKALENDIPEETVNVFFFVLRKFPNSVSVSTDGAPLRGSIFEQLKARLAKNSSTAAAAFETLLKANRFSDAQVDEIGLAIQGQSSDVLDRVQKLVKSHQVRRVCVRAMKSGYEAFDAYFRRYSEYAKVHEMAQILHRHHDACVEEVEFANSGLVHLVDKNRALALFHECKSIAVDPLASVDNRILHSLCRHDREGFRKFEADALSGVYSPLDLCAAANGCPTVVENEVKLLLATVDQFSEETEPVKLIKAVQAMSRQAWRLNGGLELPSSWVGRALSAYLRCSDARGCAEDVGSICLETVVPGPGFVSYGEKLRISDFGLYGSLASLGVEYRGRTFPRDFEFVYGVYIGRAVYESDNVYMWGDQKFDAVNERKECCLGWFVGSPLCDSSYRSLKFSVRVEDGLRVGVKDIFGDFGVVVCATKNCVYARWQGMFVLDSDSTTTRWESSYSGYCIPSASYFHFCKSTSASLTITTVDESGKEVSKKTFPVGGFSSYTVVPLERGFLFVADGSVHAYCNNEVKNLKIEAKKIIVDQGELFVRH